MMPAIGDVEIIGSGAAGAYFRVVVTFEGRDVVIYAGRVPLATVAREAAAALFLKGAYSLASDGVILDGRDRLDGDLRAELVARP